MSNTALVFRNSMPSVYSIYTQLHIFLFVIHNSSFQDSVLLGHLMELLGNDKHNFCTKIQLYTSKTGNI